MNITVFLGSTMGKSSIYLEEVEKLGKWIADAGHTLVFGGSKEGLMEKLALAVFNEGGKVIGVQTKLLNRRHGAVEGLTELELPDRMSERITRMIELGDIFVIFPGGVGTLEEAATIMSMDKLGFLNKKLYFYNINGFYDDFQKYLKRMNDEGFGEERSYENTKFISSFDELEKIDDDVQ